MKYKMIDHLHLMSYFLCLSIALSPGYESISHTFYFIYCITVVLVLTREYVGEVLFSSK
jgi:hypothetical protein